MYHHGSVVLKSLPFFSFGGWLRLFDVWTKGDPAASLVEQLACRHVTPFIPRVPTAVNQFLFNLTTVPAVPAVQYLRMQYTTPHPSNIQHAFAVAFSRTASHTISIL